MKLAKPHIDVEVEIKFRYRQLVGVLLLGCVIGLLVPAITTYLVSAENVSLRHEMRLRDDVLDSLCDDYAERISELEQLRRDTAGDHAVMVQLEVLLEGAREQIRELEGNST